MAVADDEWRKPTLALTAPAPSFCGLCQTALRGVAEMVKLLWRFNISYLFATSSDYLMH